MLNTVQLILMLLAAAALTYVLEVPVVWLFFRKEGEKDLFLYTLLINLMTNMTLNIMLMLRLNECFHLPRTVFLTGCEILIVLWEALLFLLRYSKQKFSRMLFMSVIANAFSYGMGWMITWLLNKGGVL